MNEHEHNPGSAMPDEQLEARLAGLTEWTGSTQGPLERALAATGQDLLKPGVLARIRGLAAGWGAGGLTGRQIAAVLAVGAAGVLVAGMVVPGGRPVSREIALGPPASAPAEKAVNRADWVESRATELWDWKASDGPAGHSKFGEADASAAGLQLNYFGADARDTDLYNKEAKPRSAQEPTQQTPTRQIIRRGQVEVVAADVQVAFRKAQDLIKPERGEYVQDSVLSGSGQAMTARVVLRVDPARLAEAMQASRGLGELAAEQTGGDDVTERLTDLDAQIRNEQRVEKEMLELFDLRKDAPLKDVLELREQLARVRGNIERMQAQKSQTERLVSLATLAITIRPQPDKTVAPPPVNETPSFGARVAQEVSLAWDRGTTNLAGSAGWLVETVIGKAPVWGTLAATGVVIWRIVRRRKKAGSPAGAEKAT